MTRTTPSSVFEDVPQNFTLPQESSLEFDGSRVRYWTYTAPRSEALVDSPLILMVHGFRGDHHGLALIAQELSTEWDVVVPDLPGFGTSEPLVDRTHSSETYADVIAALIQQLRPRPIVLVGHSFGSVVAARTAAHSPDGVEALALINPICEPALESSARIPSLAASAFYRACAALPAAIGDRLIRSSWVTRISSELMMKNRDPRLRRFINGQHDAYFGSFASRDVVLQAYESSIRDTVTDAAAHVQVSTALIVAEHDDLGSVPAQERLAALFPRADLHVIPEVGHLIHYETPRRAAVLIATFVEAHIPSTVGGSL
ncbi:alpha/beta fold hydrolase [Kocuria massiliensis]|uniref:alpha/beta fold hydrolase n=1 Tax=Kocuria massiliensis TaxID=1926282 RepID=UPI001FE68732|nr:alpha/beta hydrolase [Kocuria massiliensis]